MKRGAEGFGAREVVERRWERDGINRAAHVVARSSCTALADTGLRRRTIAAPAAILSRANAAIAEDEAALVEEIIASMDEMNASAGELAMHHTHLARDHARARAVGTRSVRLGAVA